MKPIAMTELDLSGKRLLMRVDFNVPFAGERISDDSRMRASLPAIEFAVQQGAALILLSHRGRPREGEYDPQYSLRPVAEHLSGLLGRPVAFLSDWIDGVAVRPGEVALCENVRFLPGEKANDRDLAKKMAALCDIFVMDAFGAAHRAHASTHGVAEFARQACAGPLLVGELAALESALRCPARPLVAIVGGAKVSSKLTILENLLEQVDVLVVGGGIANTFLAASGYPVGASLHEPALVEVAASLLQKAAQKGCAILLPEEVLCATEASAAAPVFRRRVSEVEEDEMILDMAPSFSNKLQGIIAGAGTVVWNGPLGVFEIDQFGAATRALAEAIAASGAFSLAGGGDTLAAIHKYRVADGISYISTGGGAFLEAIEGKTLPAVAILQERARGRDAGSRSPAGAG